MSGIQIYTRSPINASKASGVSQQTMAPEVQSSSQAPNPAPPNPTVASTSSYPPARPGAAPGPKPTGEAGQRHVTLQPTPTTQDVIAGPPAAQPGAVPTPPKRSAMLPPFETGDSSHRPQQTAAPHLPTSTSQSYPPQMAIPTPAIPVRAQPPSSATQITNAAQARYPVSLPVPATESEESRRSFEHPPGYQQNVYAAELTNEQSRAVQSGNSSRLGGNETSDSFGGVNNENAWNIAKTWAQQAGEKISQAEAEVWRKINRG